jgi:hypothetical protein
MVRFTVALLCLMSGVSGLMVVKESLSEVAKRESMRNPVLRKRDLETKGELERKLASIATTKRSLANNNNNGNYNGNANANENGMYWYDQSMDEEGFGFDITSYSVKYTQCATVLTYSDELAEDENSDTVLAAERFALFRLCPKDQCSSFSGNGCGRNYGEYLVSLDQFLTSMLEYQETRVSGYCQYCQKCAAIESAKSFWAAAYNNREYALKIAKASYNSWYTSYLEKYYTNSGNNNGNNYQQVDSNMAAQRYYQQVRNSNNYANQYAQTFYGSYNNANSNSASSSSSSSSSQATQQYGWANQEMWRASNSQQVQSSNQDSWNSMGSPAGSFYGKTILNGFYDEDGIFNQKFGYFNFNGEYVSLEDGEIEWDEGLWGEKPELWADVTEDTESCDYQYAGSCYNQYDACMTILQDPDYTEYQMYQQQQQNNNGQYKANAANEGRATLKDFIGCKEVDPYGGTNGNQWAVNQYYYNNGGNNNNAQKQQYNCYNNDENCQKYNQYQESMNQYNQQQSANRQYFIGPHCGSDSRTITLAVYKDQYCSVLDESSTIESVLGYAINTESNGIDLFPDECMACLRDDVSQSNMNHNSSLTLRFSEQTQVWYEGEQLYDLEPMCSMLYQYAGKCNKHMNITAQQSQQANNAGDEYQAAAENADGQYDNQYKQMYQSLAQSHNEKAVCSFIESLTSNTYNEHGEISAFDSFSYGWKGALKTPQMDSGVLAALIITAMLAVSMGIAACVLHGALARKNIPWKPRRSKGEDPTDLARQNSGITMGRSRSGVGANPLL